MEETNLDVNPAMQEVDSSTTEAQEEQTSEATNDQVAKQEENKIPLSRVREMLAKAKNEAFEEAKKNVGKAEQVDTNSEYVKSLIKNEIETFKAQFELDKALNDFPDLPKYSGDIQNLIKKNPNLGYSEAYKIARYDSITKESFSKGKQEAYKNIENKKNAAVETPKARQPKKDMDISGINVMDRSIPLSEIAKLLPKG